MNEQETKQSAAEQLKSFSDNIADTYERYLAVKRLAQALSGQLPVAPFPRGVAVTHVDIAYVIDNEKYTARIDNVTRVGDVAVLLERETERLVDVLRNLSLVVQDIGAKIVEACAAAQYKARAQQVGGPE